MKRAKGVAGLAVLAISGALALAPALHAGESVTGRWAADPSACAGFGSKAAQSPLVITSYAVRWHDDSCRIGRVYKTGDTVHIQALCWGLTGAHSVPVSLRPHGGKLAVRWDRGARGDLQRCR
jgi:hypothetical protein